MAKGVIRDRNKRKLRFIISVILSFCLALILTVGTLLAAVKIGFFSENSVLTGLNKKDYYKGAEEDFFQDARDYTIPVGLPVEVVDNIVDSETVHRDITGYVTAAVNKKTYEFDTTDLQSRLTENIYDYFRKEGLQMNEEQITTVPEYTQMVADIYVENMKVDFVTLLGRVNAVAGNYLWTGVGICAIFGIIIMIMLVRMQRWPHRGVRYIVYSTIATVVFVLTPVVVAGMIQRYAKPNITPEHLYYALMNYCASGLRAFVYLAVGWATVTVALLLFIRYLKKRCSRHRN